MNSIRQFCIDTIDLLETGGTNFGENYVNKTLEFYGQFKYAADVKQKFGLFSSGHGPDFFKVIIECLDGREWKYTYADNNGKMVVSEYEKNFYDFIKFYRTKQ